MEISPDNQAQRLMRLAGKARPDAIERHAPSEHGRGSDSVSLSPAAIRMSRIANLPGVRPELVERVRHEIASGTYETPDKIDSALDALLDQIMGIDEAE